MKINVDINNLKIIDKDQLESGEYNVTDLEFIFSPEYENLQKVAIFGCNLESEDPKYYKVILHDDKCIIPEEILHKTGQIVIGCYGYEINGEELIKRYSPVPIKIIVEQGSFRDNFENVTPPTPSELEQIQAQINQIEAKIIIINNTLHIYDTNFQTVNEAINDIKEKIDDIEGDIADTYSKQEIDNKFSEVDEALEDKVDSTVFEESQNAQDEKINYADLIISQWPKTAYSEGNNISIADTIKGKLDFDNLLYGDTKQNTLTGKNLFSGAYVKALTGGASPYPYTENNDCRSAIIKVNPNTTYTISKNTSNRFRISEYSTQPQVGANATNYIQAGDSATQYTLTTQSTTNYVLVQVSNQNEENVKLQVELGSTATSYEPYCGGIPSPNPNYPQDIQVVTGEQEVVVKNGNNEVEATYTIHLRNLELAKIGTYQDYIYFDVDEGKWYKKKAIEKKIFNGSETWTLSSGWAKPNSNVFYLSNTITTGAFFVDNNTIPYMFSNYYEVTTRNLLNSEDKNNIGLSGGFTVPNLTVRTLKSINGTDVNTFKTWLNTNNLIVYYALKETSQTDEEITDTTLIEELNSLYNAYSYSGTTNIQVEGTLAGGLKVRALKQLS